MNIVVLIENKANIELLSASPGKITTLWLLIDGGGGGDFPNINRWGGVGKFFKY